MNIEVPRASLNPITLRGIFNEIRGQLSQNVVQYLNL